MLRPAALILCATLTLTGCARLADSRLNPGNWFNRSTETATPANRVPIIPEGRTVRTIDQRQLIASVEALEIARTPSGAIVRATGLAATQGFFNAELVNRGVENGVLTFDFRVEAPRGFQDIGPTGTRRITAATALSTGDLAGIRSIRVQGAQNARTSNR